MTRDAIEATGRIETLDAAIFDLDGVVTRTARLHAAAWKRLFDDFLTMHEGDRFAPFTDEDYRRHVDGKPREDGVRDFLAARGIEVPEGDPADPPERETVHGLGNRKNAVFHELLAEGGVEVFEGSVALIRSLRDRGVRTALVSASRNAMPVLKAAGLTELFEVVVDGVEAARLGLAGKPAPDGFLEAARRLGVPSDRAAVVEDAMAGVAAGRAGGFALVVGVARTDDGEALRRNGADLVVGDLAELVAGYAAGSGSGSEALSNALDRTEEIGARLATKRLVVFLDYDGTLTPIVARPDMAVLSEPMRASVERLAGRCPLAIVSGRDRADVARLVGLEGLIYAGSHGFDIAGPNGLRQEHPRASEFLPALDAAEIRLAKATGGIDGALIERKKFAIAVHYRQVTGDRIAEVEDAVAAVAVEAPDLRQTTGKMILELRPRVDWDKGRAVLWLLDALGLDGDDVLPVYVGDDDTDEDAFAALAGCGLGILVTDAERPTAAEYILRDTDEVGRFLDTLAAMLSDNAR